MKKFFLFASLAVAACSNEPEVVDLSPDVMKEALAKAAPVKMPPMIQASHTYRCKDNSLLYIDFYTDKTAQLRTKKAGTATVLTSAASGQPYVAQGYSVSSIEKQISVNLPGKTGQSCHA